MKFPWNRTPPASTVVMCANTDCEFEHNENCLMKRLYVTQCLDKEKMKDLIIQIERDKYTDYFRTNRKELAEMTPSEIRVNKFQFGKFTANSMTLRALNGLINRSVYVDYTEKEVAELAEIKCQSCREIFRCDTAHFLQCIDLYVREGRPV